MVREGVTKWEAEKEEASRGGDAERLWDGYGNRNSMSTDKWPRRARVRPA